MPDFILGRLKFKFMGAWEPTTDYIKDDVVRVGGRAYVCIANHTSGTTFAAGSNWDIMVDGIRWTGPWTAATYYEVNDLVNYSGDVHICNTAHTAGATWAEQSSKFSNFTG